MLNKLIFITGANGEMGHSLINELNQKGFNNIIALDLEPQKHKFNIIKFYKGSVLDEELLNRINKQHHISFIYHLAAILSTKAEQNPQLANDVNIQGTKNILNFANKQSLKQNIIIPFFFPSSIAVYNVKDNKEIKINESQYFDNPITQYGKAKLICENMGIKYNKKYKTIDFRSIRFPGIISATSIPTGGTSDFAPEMIHCAAQGKAYDCFVNHDRRIPFIVMPDAIEAIFKIMKVKKNKLKSYVYNINSFSPTVHDFYILTKRFFSHFDIQYKIDDKRQNIIDSWPSYLNDENAKNDWGWEPKFNLENSYENYIIPEIKKKYKEGIQE